MTAANRAACVIGWPVEHSRSPLIHNYWLKQYGIAGEYRRELVPREEFASFVKSLAARGYVGANVTVPHKEAALALSQPDERARAVGAVNTLWLDDGVLRATNTDVEGFLDNLDVCAPGWDRELNKAVVLGAGGAARAVIFGLLARGAERLVVVNRTLERAETLRRKFGARVERWAGIKRTPRSAMRRSSSTPRRSGCRDSPLSLSISRGSPAMRSSPILSMRPYSRRSLPRQKRAVCEPPMGSACCCIRRYAALRCGSEKPPR